MRGRDVTVMSPEGRSWEKGVPAASALLTAIRALGSAANGPTMRVELIRALAGAGQTPTAT